MIKLLIGGSPCTYWSIAKTKGREVVAEGQGWELFKNYLIAIEMYIDALTVVDVVPVVHAYWIDIAGFAACGAELQDNY